MRARILQAVAGGAVLATAACAGGGSVSSRANVSPGGVETRVDAASPNVQYVGREQRVTENGQNTSYFLRSFRNRTTGAVSHQLYVTDRYRAREYRNWSRATGPGNTTLQYVAISRDVEQCPDAAGCPRVEAFGVTLPHAALTRAGASGYTVRAYSRGGASVTLPIAGAAVQAQLEATARPLPTP
ncbi:MAG TPA: hypothetical protein VF665_00885 [Longimicrobium sp.]|uniref:hypothetical protein n=1 Tax=Longimicrobium sp. TaxID=2029185 RepID=UPI002ED95555